MHPQRDWLIGLGISIAIFVAGAALSTYTYIANIEVSQTSSETAEEVVVYRESMVEAALEQLRERETVFLSVLGSPVPTVPVIPVATTTPTISDQEEPEVPAETEVNQAPSSLESGEIVPAPL